MRSRVLPCLPTTCPTRFSSCAMCWLAATISLNVSATFPASPTHVPGSRTVKSPSRMVCKLARMTARSRDSSATAAFDFPLRDPSFFNTGGVVPTEVGGTTAGSVLFISSSPETMGSSTCRAIFGSYSESICRASVFVCVSGLAFRFRGARIRSQPARKMANHLDLSLHWYHSGPTTRSKVFPVGSSTPGSSESC